MPSSIILELQHDALDRGVLISDLLRKALVISRKLNLQEFKEWVENELNGYEASDDMPKYREFSGKVRAWNPYNGWIPVMFKHPEKAELLSRRKSGQSIASFEQLLTTPDDSALAIPFPQSVQRDISESIDFQTEVVLFIDKASVVALLDAVRTIVLNWTLKLEEQGILGVGLSFTHDEKNAAEQTPQNINNFFGTVHNPQVQQGGVLSAQVTVNSGIDLEALKSFLELLRGQIGSIPLSPEKQEEAEAEVGTIESQLRSPKPKMAILRESLQSLQRILGGAGGGAAGQLLFELGKLALGG